MKKSDFGLIGLAVMGENLARNMARNGISVSLYNRITPNNPPVVDHFMERFATEGNFQPTYSPKELVASLRTPRKIMMMIRAGAPVDEMIEQLTPLLSEGDILIDGGNSYFLDTKRRVESLAKRGILFVGAGVSGGAEGALHGPSIMPGGNPMAWPSIRADFKKIAAKLPDGFSCCEWVGPGGSGHFVKSVHNAIEYGDMQLIAEAYLLLREVDGMDNESLSEVFAAWNRGPLESYLMEISARIVRFREETGHYLIDRIVDAANQKGTGKWSTATALEEGVPVSVLSEAVFARMLSSRSFERAEAAALFTATAPRNITESHTPLPLLSSKIEKIREALYAAKLIAYAQGFSLLHETSKLYDWKLDYGTLARLWQAGCIIRSAFLGNITEAYRRHPQLQNLLFDDFFTQELSAALNQLRETVAEGALRGIPLPCMNAALAYFDGLRSPLSGANLIQAQRDYFGAHTFERTDAPRGTFFHNHWDKDSLEP